MADDKKDEKFVEPEEIEENLEFPDGASIAKEVEMIEFTSNNSFPLNDSFSIVSAQQLRTYMYIDGYINFK